MIASVRFKCCLIYSEFFHYSCWFLQLVGLLNKKFTSKLNIYTQSASAVETPPFHLNVKCFQLEIS